MNLSRRVMKRPSSSHAAITCPSKRPNGAMGIGGGTGGAEVVEMQEPQPVSCTRQSSSRWRLMGASGDSHILAEVATAGRMAAWLGYASQNPGTHSLLLDLDQFKIVRVAGQIDVVEE